MFVEVKSIDAIRTQDPTLAMFREFDALVDAFTNTFLDHIHTYLGAHGSPVRYYIPQGDVVKVSEVVVGVINTNHPIPSERIQPDGYQTVLITSEGRKFVYVANEEIAYTNWLMK